METLLMRPRRGAGEETIVVEARTRRPGDEGTRAPVPIKTGIGVPGAGASGPAPPPALGWGEAGLVLIISALFPGSAQSYVRHWKRGILVSLLFLAVLYPAALAATTVFSSFSRAVPVWLAGALLGAGAIFGVGPALCRLRRRAWPGSTPRSWIVGVHAAAVFLGFALEAWALLGSCIGTAQAETDALFPLLRRDETAVLLISHYVRPVHEDVVLFRPHAASPESPRSPILGRVLAKPGDRLDARGGALQVNGIALDLLRTDQRFALEQAARSEKLRRGLSTVLHPLSGPSSPPPGYGPGACLRWDEADWGPAVLPTDVFLVLPDEDGDVPRGCYVLRGEILGRVIGRIAP